MAKLERKNFKVFGENAPLDEIGQFGSAKATTKKNTKDIEEIQELDAWSDGWGGAVISNKNYPPMEEMTGAMNVMSYQTAYTLQEGIPEWNKDTTYYKGSIVKNLEGEDVKLYQSISNDNLNNPLSNTDNWSEISFGTGLEVCDIGMALYVDETKGLRRYLNGQVVDINANTQAFLDRLKQIQATNPDYFATEENWQAEALLNIDGCVYKFVLNYADDGVTIISVRLPKYPDYVEVDAGNVAVKGNGMTLGLTNGTQNVGIHSSQPATSRCLTLGIENYGLSVGSSSKGSTATNALVYGVTTDSTKSGIVGTLTQTKLKLRYFIQIATGSETENNIINDIELNNPYSFGDSKYSPIELNNISWLASNGQWNAKATYPDYYDWILTNVNNGVDGFKLSTAEDITDYDWVINTSDETFRLPLSNNQRFVIETHTDGANGYRIWSDGYCEQWGIITFNDTRSIISNVSLLKSFKDTNYIITSNVRTNLTTELAVLSTTEYRNKTKNSFTLQCATYNNANWCTSMDWKASGYLADGEYTSQNLNLYYYVGETVQNANLIDAGRIGEQLSGLVEVGGSLSMPSEKLINFELGASGTNYKAPCSGYVYIAKKSTAANQYLDVGTAKLHERKNAYTSSEELHCFLPVYKSFYVNYTAAGDLVYFRFIPCRGDV
ncbi:MAG: hypothetical protein ACI3T9_05880 [Romboutsia timonensis]